MIKNRRVKKATLRYCAVPTGDGEIQLYFIHRGVRLVLVQGSLKEVLQELRRLHGFLNEEGPKMIRDMVCSQRKAAVSEFGRIVGKGKRADE